MRNPLAFIPIPNRKPVFFFLLVGTLILVAVFQSIHAPLRTAPAPFGIVSLQVAWTAEKAQAILDSWDATARLHAAFGLGIDYLFMAFYGLTLALGALLAAGRHPGWFARAGSWVGWGALLAAVADGNENAGQYLQLFSGRADLASVVGIFASLKFVLIVIALVYGLAGWFWPRKKQETKNKRAGG
jgi:hypothetical protein